MTFDTNSSSPVLDLFDTHCHITYGELREDADGAWQRARQDGVSRAVVVGIDAASSEELVAWVPERPGLSCSVGIHPNAAGEATDSDWKRVAALAHHPQVVGVGETGIDLYRERASLERQEELLRRHVALALEHDKALILHLRDGFAEAARVLEPLLDPALRAVVHCFTGGPDDLQPFAEWGFWFSFSGILTYPKAQPPRDAAALVREDRLVIETDAPWLAPVPHRGQTNEPAYVRHTAATLADLRGESLEATAALTTRNAEALFGLDRPA